MKTNGLKPNSLCLLAAMSLLALSPALCLANSRECANTVNTQTLKSSGLDLYTLEAGLRTGRLTSTSPWRTLSKKNPELTNLTQKIFRAKTRWVKSSQLDSRRALPVYRPQFLVLRI